MHTCAASAASSPSGIATMAVRGVINSLTGRSANASTPETTPISSAPAGSPPRRPRLPPPTWPPAPARRAAPARAGSPLPLDDDASDAAPIDALDHHLVSVEGQLVAGAGHPSQHEIHQASHGRDLGMLERAAECLRQVVQ